MMTMDRLLEEMREQRVDPRLEALDGVILARSEIEKERHGRRRNLVATGVLGLGVGLMASLLSPPAEAGRSSGLNTLPSGAPSRLLLGVR